MEDHFSPRGGYFELQTLVMVLFGLYVVLLLPLTSSKLEVSVALARGVAEVSHR